MAGFGAKDSSGNFYFKALGDGEIKLGNTSDDVTHVTGSAHFNGPVNFGTVATNLGSGTTSTLIPTGSVHLLDATSITTGGMGMHIMSIANGSYSGQLLKIIMNTTTNNQPIMVDSSNILGAGGFSAIAIENNKQGAALEFVWTGSKWAVMSVNVLASMG